MSAWYLSRSSPKENFWQWSDKADKSEKMRAGKEVLKKKEKKQGNNPRQIGSKHRQRGYWESLQRRILYDLFGHSNHDVGSLMVLCRTRQPIQHCAKLGSAVQSGIVGSSDVFCLLSPKRPPSSSLSNRHLLCTSARTREKKLRRGKPVFASVRELSVSPLLLLSRSSVEQKWELLPKP